MQRTLSILLCATALLTLTACSSFESRSRKLQLGMTREQVVKTLGNEYTVAGAKKEANGSTIEVLRFGEKKDPGVYAYFHNGQLVQWGDQQVLQTLNTESKAK
jgi:hypothetical protein